MTPLRTVPTQRFLEHQQLPQGLSQPLACFQQPHYLANLLQAFFNLYPDRRDYTLVIGANGQSLTHDWLQLMIKVAAGNDFRRIMVGTQGLLSPVMLSYLVRQHQAIAGILLGIETKEGEQIVHLTFYSATGQVISASLLSALQERTQILQHYCLAEIPDLPLKKAEVLTLGTLHIEVVNSANLYQRLMAGIFDLDLIQVYWQNHAAALAVHCFDTVNFAYSQFLLEKTLGLPSGTVTFENFPVHFDGIAGQINLPPMKQTQALRAVLTHYRYGIFGSQLAVTASDSLVILTDNATLIPGYRGNCEAVGRSQLASAAVDHVCMPLDITYYETPSPWEWMGATLDGVGVAFVGNEGGEIGASYSRERDGLWAILFWLNICALRQSTVESLLRSHWLKYGRNYHGRFLYGEFPLTELLDWWETFQSQDLRGQTWHGRDIAYSYPLKYYDRSQFQVIDQWGYTLGLTNGDRLIFCPVMSPHTPELGNLQVYLEHYEVNPQRHTLTPAQALDPLKTWLESLTPWQELNKALRPTTRRKKTR
ncbi:MAG: hypothetical protein ACKN9E_19495 [Microcystaceae cyanobacterium]